MEWKTVQSRTFGESEDKVYDDWDGINESTSLPDSAAYCNVDKIFLEAGGDDSLRPLEFRPPTKFSPFHVVQLLPTDEF